MQQSSVKNTAIEEQFRKRFLPPEYPLSAVSFLVASGASATKKGCRCDRGYKFRNFFVPRKLDSFIKNLQDNLATLTDFLQRQSKRRRNP